MSDSFTEVTSESWFSRLGNAIKGVVVGLILFIVAFPLLWWNEGRAVRTAKGLKEAQGVVVDISPERADPSHDKQLVHLTGEAKTDETLTDAEFAVSAPAIKLKRRVEMYQWKESSKTEERKKLGGGTEKITTYTYDKVWSDTLNDSSSFKKKEGHLNPASMRFASAEKTAEQVKVGAFKLSPGLIQQMNKYEPLPFGADEVAKLPDELKNQAKIDANKLYLPVTAEKPAAEKPAAEKPAAEKPAAEKPTAEKPAAEKPAVKAAAAPGKPEVGDLRIEFQVVRPATVSLMARQLGETFEAWKSSTGTAIERLAMGSVSAENMVGEMERENTILTWVLRVVGWLLMAAGIGMVCSPMAVLADVIPLLGDLLRMGVSLFAGTVALCLSLITIAAAWLAYRPVLGVGLLVGAAVLIVGLKRLGSKKRQAAAA